MSKQENAPTEQPIPAPEQSEVKAAFNPFVVLSGDEIAALAGSFNKQWRAANAVSVVLAMTEHGCSENDAVFVAWLKAEANAILDRQSVTNAVKFIDAQLTGVAFPASTKVSLGLIETAYTALKTELRKTVGIRVRDAAQGRWQAVTANAVLDQVYEHLKITEKDWMR